MDIKMISVKYRSVYIKIKDVKEGPVFITGFRGFGAIGLITVHHLVRALKMKRIGFLTTRFMPELSYADEKGFGGPFEFYYDESRNLLALLNRELPPPPVRLDFARALARLLQEINVKYAILVGGLDKRFKENNDSIKWASSSTYKGPYLDDKILEDWLYVIGPLALLMVSFEEELIPSILLLPYSEVERPDPIAAAVAIQRISKLIGERIDVSELYEESKRLEEEFSRIEKIQREYGEKTRSQSYM